MRAGVVGEQQTPGKVNVIRAGVTAAMAITSNHVQMPPGRVIQCTANGGNSTSAFKNHQEGAMLAKYKGKRQQVAGQPDPSSPNVQGKAGKGTKRQARCAKGKGVQGYRHVRQAGMAQGKGKRQR